jgi:hypothetical protein
MAIRSSFLAYA